MKGGSLGSSGAGIQPQSSDHLDEANARLGRTIAGRWTLVSLLGVGGMASVYEARHRNGRKAALKILHPHVSSLPSARRRFLSEGYAANKVEHPGAVLVLDDGDEGDVLFLVMELLNGRSLAERLSEQGPLPADVVARVATEVLDVLAWAHDRGVIHRDIKPSNVFELDSGAIKVLDFGVAQVRSAESSAITESGVSVGTPAFMAPEQAAGRLDEVGAPADIWAVGATMFQLLTGRLVHQAATRNAAIVAAATSSVIPVRKLRPDLPHALAAVIDRALAFRPEDRWPNARAMRLSLLESTAAGAPRPDPASLSTLPEAEPGTARTLPAAKAPEKKRVVPWLVLGALLVAAGIWAARTPRTAPQTESTASVHAARSPNPATNPTSDPNPDPNAAAPPNSAPPNSASTPPPTAPPQAAKPDPSPRRTQKKPAPRSASAEHPAPERAPPAAAPSLDEDEKLIDTRQ
jgi:serine/threonine-protein kinase